LRLFGGVAVHSPIDPKVAGFMGAAYERRKSRVSRVRESEESQFLRSRG
jgi:hypothetical protein